VLTAHRRGDRRDILYVESSRSWGGQEIIAPVWKLIGYAHGHQAWLICNPDSQVTRRRPELGTRLVTMPLRSRVDPFGSLRPLEVLSAEQNRFAQTYSSKITGFACHFPLRIPLSRARLHQPINRQPKSRICFKYGCSANRCDASVIKRQLVEKQGIDPRKN